MHTENRFMLERSRLSVDLQVSSCVRQKREYLVSNRYNNGNNEKSPEGSQS